MSDWEGSTSVHSILLNLRNTYLAPLTEIHLDTARSPSLAVPAPLSILAPASLSSCQQTPSTPLSLIAWPLSGRTETSIVKSFQLTALMSYSYERNRRQTYGASSRRTAWGYWIPLAVTVTVATAGLIAWVWSERKENEEDDDLPPPHQPPPGYNNGPPAAGYGAPSQDYGAPPPGSDGPPGFGGPPGQYPPHPGQQIGGQPPYAPGQDARSADDQGIVAQMSGALRRTPSPQQMFDAAKGRVVAGVTAAGAVVGGALSSIREEDKTGYEDHSRWSEEADSQTGGRTGPTLQDLETSSSVTARQGSHSSGKVGSRRKIVAIVVSAETDYEHSEDANYHQEHAVSRRRR